MYSESIFKSRGKDAHQRYEHLAVSGKETRKKEVSFITAVFY
jgi:hypothetical protein